MGRGGEPFSIGVIGAGSWGTALANLLAERTERVALWVYEEAVFRRMAETRENGVFLPGVRLADNLHPTLSLEECFRGNRLLICAVPSHVVRSVFLPARPFVQPDTFIVSATKGLDENTHQTVSQVLKEIFPGPDIRVGCLSGPSFAREVSRRLPTAVASAGLDPESARRVQEIFTRPYFRVYSNPDLIGVELGGAMKNVMAIAAGVSDGLGLGNSSRAALITRGLAEMTRLGVSLGAQAQTFFGLAGMGDLVLTCTGDLSRNRRVGLELGRGKKLREVLEGMSMVAEGVRTTKALKDLAGRGGVEMPITEKMYEILYEGKDAAAAVSELMSREPRSEG